MLEPTVSRSDAGLWVGVGSFQDFFFANSSARPFLFIRLRPNADLIGRVSSLLRRFFPAMVVLQQDIVV